LYFWIFPVTVIGNVSTNFQYRGILNVAILPLQKARKSSPVRVTPGRSLTHAISSSPYFTSGTPITCTSAISGLV
jgi:hypothetical protein